jgi:hypothetical protein
MIPLSCGLFVIANVVDVTFNFQPQHSKYIKSQMKTHIKDYIIK